MTRFRIVALASAIVLLTMTGSMLAIRWIAFRAAERSLFVLHANGTSRPDDYGAPSSLVWMQSGPRRLQASIVRAPLACGAPVAVLLFHGRGETISDWARLQAFLSHQCISSMAFDYSGHGSSTPPAHIATLDADARVAYTEFLYRFPGPVKRCVLGHSMGVAPMLSVYPSLHLLPDCAVVANGFSSLEAMAREGGAPASIALFLRRTWNNLTAIKEVHGPLLVVHSDADQVVPASMAAQLDAAAPPAAIRIALHAFDHNALYENPTLDWWAPILAFLKKPHSSATTGGAHG